MLEEKFPIPCESVRMMIPGLPCTEKKTVVEAQGAIPPRNHQGLEATARILHLPNGHLKGHCEANAVNTNRINDHPPPNPNEEGKNNANGSYPGKFIASLHFVGRNRQCSFLWLCPSVNVAAQRAVRKGLLADLLGFSVGWRWSGGGGGTAIHYLLP